jgi:hypothetical protein
MAGICGRSSVGVTRPARACAVVVATATLAACVSAHRIGPDGERERVPAAELRTHAEQVFKRHNAVSTAFLTRMDALEQTDPARYEALADLETRMYAACAPVDELAVAYRDGERVGLFAKMRLARSLDACAETTAEAEQALQATSP